MPKLEKLHQRLLAIGKFVLDAIAPLKCLGCDKIGAIACADCLSKVKIELKTIPGQKLMPTTVSVADFDEPLLKNLIHALKYEGVSAASEPLANWLIKELGRLIQPGDVLMPVPLHSIRQRERGFNQSEKLIKKIADKFQIPISRNLKRVRNTKPQVECTGEERRINLKNAFIYKGGLNAKRILLLDDVTTTGSTFLECTKAIRKISDVPILAIAVARG